MRYTTDDKTGTVIVNSSTSIVTLLTVLFVALKLCKVITWSWFWVLSPLIFSFGLWLLVLIIAVIAAIIMDK